MKMHICGIYGSGKSALARILSEEFGIDYYSLDDIKYKVKYSQVRSVEDRIKEVRKICKKKDWITEGTWSDYAIDAFKEADLIIIMDTPKHVCIYRILKRHISRKKLENDNFIGALKLARQVFRYHKTKNPVSKFAHNSLIKKFEKDFIVIRKTKEIPGLIYSLKKQLKN